MKNAEEYAEIIMRDEREKIVTETPTVYQDDKIERIYEFADGAIVKYEWQNAPRAERFNHRFSLIAPPAPNPHNLKKGIIKAIDYPYQ
jgi:cytosine/adenosine deaminase-related metal-dependent hydrolase